VRKNGADYGLTAGQCTANTDGVEHENGLNWPLVGTASSDTYQSGTTTSDAVIYRLNNQSAATNEIISGDIYRHVIGTKVEGEGGRVCHSGVMTHTDCWELIIEVGDEHLVLAHSLQYGYPYWVRFKNNFACVAFATANGDSGAPVYTRSNFSPPYNAYAAGIVSYWWSDGGAYCFDLIANTLNWTGTTIRTSG